MVKKMQVIINEVPIHFEVQFSKRSKMTLDVSDDGYLTLKVPTKQVNMRSWTI